MTQRTVHTVRLALILAALLIAGALERCAGQQPVNLGEWAGYPGNPLTRVLTLLPADSSAVVTATLLYTVSGPVAGAVLQPSVGKIGRVATVSWTGAQTAQLPQNGWVEVKLNQVTRYTARVIVSRLTGVQNTGTASQTIVQPPGTVVQINTGTVGNTGSNSVTLHVVNAQSGYPLPHGLGTRLLDSVATWDDTGLPDALWRVIPINNNTAELRGPPGEIFTGSISITGFKIITP